MHLEAEQATCARLSHDQQLQLLTTVRVLANASRTTPLRGAR